MKKMQSGDIHRKTNESQKGGNEDEVNQRRKLEGDRKITQCLYLSYSWPKILFLGIPLVLTVVGLYCLIKHKQFRVNTLFTVQSNFDPTTTTHIFLTIDDDQTELVTLKKEQFKKQDHYTFWTQLLKYEIIDNFPCPVSSFQKDRVSELVSRKEWLLEGLKEKQVQERLSFFGLNEHRVEIPGYFSQMFEVMTQPLFLLQYFIFGVWLIQKLYINTLANFSFCLAVNTVNYIIQYYNFCKIRSMAQKEFNVTVIRDGKLKEVPNTLMVPGDIYLVQHHIPCDSIVLNGDIMVNQVNFTGENLPIIKSSIEDMSQFKDKAHWIFEGSEILKVKDGSLAVSIQTGYTSHRGQIIRKIVKHSVKEPEFTHRILWFFVAAYLMAGLIYLSYLAKLTTFAIREDTIVFLFFEIVSLAVPVGYIGVLNFFPGMSLIRLDMSSIYGKDPYKVYESAHIKTICFDKTGTLTNNSVEIADIFVNRDHLFLKATDSFHKELLLQQLFGTCHMITKRQEEGQPFLGDEIDLKMFERSRGVIKESVVSGVLWEIELYGEVWQVLRVNQFESKHMSMSVLVRNAKTGEIFVFVKGSPELIQKVSTNDCSALPLLVKELSFEGFRVIGVGYKCVESSQLSHYLKMPRQDYLEGIRMLGLVSFINKLKEESTSVIDRLRREVQVDVKMITGDNIYTAVQTSFKAGLILPNEYVLVCQSKNVMSEDSLKIKGVLISNNKGIFHQKIQIIDSLMDFIKNRNNNTVLALEGGLLYSLQYPEIIAKTKVFARVSPQQKTEIIKLIQNGIQEEENMREGFRWLCGPMPNKVCMVGDGANDLMAIKQSDVGVGLSESDGTASADFVVSKLWQIEEIIREGKAISQVAIQTLLMFFINTWLYIPLMLLTLHDLCTFSEETMFYKNVAFIVLIPFFQGLTKPRPDNTSTPPQINVLALQHQLTIWINNLIFSAASAISFWYYWHSDDYETNHRGWVSMKDQFTTESKSSTICFKVIVAHCLSVIFNIYQNRPWKESLSKNKVFTGWLILQVVLGYVAFFRQEWFPFMNLVPLSNSVSIVILMILAVAFLLSFIVCTLIFRHFTVFQGKEGSQQ